MTARRGFTLIEVILASMIASGGLIAIYGGLTNCVAAEERRYFYETCAGFLETGLQYALDGTVQFGPTSPPVEGDLVFEGPPVHYRISAQAFSDPSTDGVVGVTQVTVVFTGTIGGKPVEETLVTYLHPDLAAERKTVQVGP